MVIDFMTLHMKGKFLLGCKRFLWFICIFSISAVGASKQPIPVTVQSLEELVVFPEASAPAKVITLNDSHLSAEVNAVIVHMPVEVGEVVEPGTPLIQLEKEDLALALKRAEATLKSLIANRTLAKRQLDRIQSLASKSLISEEELNQRQTTLTVSEAEIAVQRIAIKQLKRDLEKTVIRAPFKAIVVEHLSHVGELARPGTPLIRILDADRILGVAKLPPHDSLSLSKASKIEFVNGNDRYRVQVYSVTPALDIRERTQEVRLRFVDKPALIGATGDIVWRHKEPYLSTEFLVRRKGKMGVFVVKEGHARFIDLPGAEEGRPAKIDLPNETFIIVDGRFVIQDGDPVRAIQARSALD